VETLSRRGVKEISLIAQELTYYGLDLYKKRMLPDLLKRLSDVPGIEWIRLHYAYPHKFPMEILNVMKERSNICNYLDMPLQHAADNMLKAMRRLITRAEWKTYCNRSAKQYQPFVCVPRLLPVSPAKRSTM
jgi:ribosomal protein S12 methylthiotransferase